MADRLKNKIALIFGVDSITEGIAIRFVQEGAHVTIIDDAATLDAFQIMGTRAIALDDISPEAVNRAAVAAIGDTKLDILVIGGGDVPLEADWKPINAVTIDQLRTGQHDIASALTVAQASEAALIDGGGSVIFLFSPAGLYSEGGWGDRTVVHHAKRGLARTLAMEWGHAQVRVNMLVPQAKTPGLAAYRARNPAAVDFRISKVAMGRLGDPVTDIGGAAVFLASDDTVWLTGSMIFADGGGFLTTPVVETRLDRA